MRILFEKNSDGKLYAELQRSNGGSVFDDHPNGGVARVLETPVFDSFTELVKHIETQTDWESRLLTDK